MLLILQIKLCRTSSHVKLFPHLRNGISESKLRIFFFFFSFRSYWPISFWKRLYHFIVPLTIYELVLSLQHCQHWILSLLVFLIIWELNRFCTLICISFIYSISSFGNCLLWKSNTFQNFVKLWVRHTLQHKPNPPTRWPFG